MPTTREERERLRGLYREWRERVEAFEDGDDNARPELARMLLAAECIIALPTLLDALDEADALHASDEQAIAHAQAMQRLLAEQLRTAGRERDELRLRLAIWSGEGVPSGWEAAADGYPYLVRRRGEWAVTIDPQARIGFAWAGWWRLGEDDCAEQVIESAATATEALAAAEAWLAAVAP